MGIRTLEAPRFVRRTQLGPSEYRKDFRQVDCDIIAAVTSREADAVTPLMSKIYLRLVNAPAQCWEREGVLRFEAELREERQVKAWDALCELLGVASATASKSLRWMHEQGVIGYFAGKNGVGIRIFLNRASSSIGSRAASKKILEFPPASSGGARASSDEAAFSDSFAVLESLDTDINPRAPKSGADSPGVVKSSLIPQRPEPAMFQHEGTRTARGTAGPVFADKISEVLLGRLEPAMRAAAAQAAAREHERTREWLESRGLPKAARVAQREAFNVLRQHGLVGDAAARTRASIKVDRGQCDLSQVQQLSAAELRELAETCVAMLEVHGQSIDVTLAGLSAEAGGVLLVEDAAKVRELTRTLASDGGKDGHLADDH
ncbi:MAG: hypothetical protein QOJ70_1982 [Acidobacteriota bacterium]|jgi:hypothetical protein|nr:hypothetical protein [Acidobacteriota bacterium]